MDPIPSDTAPSDIARLLVSGHFQLKEPREALELAEFLGKVCPNPRLCIVAISEILLNAIEHGNLGIKAEDKLRLQKEHQWVPEIERRLKLPHNLNKYVSVKVTRLGNEIKIHVQDEGMGFNWKELKKLKIDTHSTQGRGILLAENLAFKSIEYSEKGNEVICVIDLNPHPPL